MSERSKAELREVSNGELRALREARERLGGEVERLSAELARVRDEAAQTRREAQDRALRQTEELGALRGQSLDAQDQSARLQAELGDIRRRQAEREHAKLEGELVRLRSEINNVRATQSTAARELWELRRDHAAAIAGLTRPGPVGGPPLGTSAALAQDYLIAASSGLMDVRWYRARYPDVSQTSQDPILHYVEHGWREGRRPGPAFDGDAYLTANPDLAAAGVNPLVHFHTEGAAELRPIAPPPAQDASPAQHDHERLAAPGRLWFYVGDLIEWQRDHENLTGVGRVTSELLFAALLEKTAEVRLCVADPGLPGLVQLRDPEPIREAVRRSARNFSEAEEEIIQARLSPPASRLAKGDHVVFTGVVWTEPYIELFRRLTEAGVGFSLLVHDIIPLHLAAAVGGGPARGSGRGLRAALETADANYVSTRHVAEDVARWAVAARVRPRARIVEIGFGSRLLAAPAPTGEEWPDGVDRDDFVLCVGTIDTRKNQRALVHVWTELAVRHGAACPQLLLVGRDDLALQTEPLFRSLEALGKVKLLTGVSDRQLAALYRACRFTAFPSTSEGYGLPVAESLAHGKLCIASDLPAVRAHAGDFAWYFDPTSTADAIAMFDRAVTHPGEVQAASERIARDHCGRRWSDTFADMRAGLDLSSAEPPQAPQPREADAYAGSAALSERAVLARAERWCVDDEVEVSIVIVNWNAAALTLDCIRQVWAASEGLRYEIIIADNGSRDAERAPLRRLGPGVRLIEIGCNRFFGEANNIAVEAARGRFVCFLNNDAFGGDGWLQALRRGFEDHPRAGAVGPLFRFPDGRVQEAGGFIDESGYPKRAGREELELNEELRKDRVVDYISAAALLVDRELFLQIGGFDLAYEPAYYEDTDLCFKIAAAGRSVVCTPKSVVVHIEGASANGDPVAELRRKHLGDLNRAKFHSRWSEYLLRRDDESLADARRKLALDRSVPGHRPTGRKAIVYTPEPLTPGGGERYILTLFERLTKSHDVVFVTPHPYSRIRVRDLAQGFGLDLSAIELRVEADEPWDEVEVQVVTGNHVVPPAPARARVNLFHCQFPFPMETPLDAERRGRLAGYDRILVNSRFTALHVASSLNGLQLPDVPIDVLPPPSRQLAAAAKSQDVFRILSVGRFFRGGHSKRQDLLIDAFSLLLARSSAPMELHFAGSSHPAPENMDYLAELMAAAKGRPIHFHVNAATQDLDALNVSANIYWHGTGLGRDLVTQPWAAEHFGISIVEAMSTGAVPLALASGGAREIIQHGKSGFLYDTVDALVEETLGLIDGPEDRRRRMAAAAAARARDYSVEAFGAKFDALLRELKVIS